VRILVWAFRAFVFFTLFAFALNNQHTVTVHWFFGARWNAPMVIIVLVVFAAGCGIGALVMLPGWWRQRRVARQSAAPRAVAAVIDAQAPVPAMAAGGAVVPVHPPRDGL
jgi:putative membrane protein